MSTMSGPEVVAYLEHIRAELLREQRRLREAQGEQPARQAEIDKDSEAAWAHMLGALVPTLQGPALDTVAARLALPTVGAAATAERRTRRQQQLERRLAEIEAAPEYRQRERLLNEAEIRLAELRDNLQPLLADVLLLEAEPLWDELMAESYGTPDYARKWYQGGYFRHWKFGDRIVDKHGQRMRARDFKAVREKYVEEKQAAVSLRDEVQRLEERSARVQALVQQHAEARAGLDKLDDWLLEQTRALVREHLAPLSLADITPLVQNDPALLLAAKRVHGAQAKREYLGAIGEEWLGKPVEDVERRIEKVSLGIAKYGRAKYAHVRFPRAEIEARYGLPVEKWRQRWERYHGTSRDIVAFNTYDRVEPLTQFLWWDMMTHHHHGGFIPAVADYHRHHAQHEVYADTSARDELRTSDAS
jgi:hypothetical protein